MNKFSWVDWLASKLGSADFDIKDVPTEHLQAVQAEILENDLQKTKEYTRHLDEYQFLVPPFFVVWFPSMFHKDSFIGYSEPDANASTLGWSWKEFQNLQEAKEFKAEVDKVWVGWDLDSRGNYCSSEKSNTILNETDYQFVKEFKNRKDADEFVKVNFR